MSLDNLSYLALDQQKTDFPAHYHETYCISLITSGIEQLDVNNQSHYSEAGSITITHPYEVHSQPILSKDSSAGFITIYLSADLLNFYTKNEVSSFVNRRIDNHEASIALLDVKNHIGTQKIERALERFIHSLNPYVSNEKYQDVIVTNSWIDEVKDFIDYNISGKIILDELASVANINKFGFAKAFKMQTGMSPMNYVLMHKIFTAKKHISADSNLTSIAYQFDFTDMAHFSNTFKRFIGISPKAFQNELS